MSVYHDVSHITYDACGTVPAAWKLVEIMIFVNETRCAFTFQEIFVVDQINEKRDIGFHAADQDSCNALSIRRAVSSKQVPKGSNLHEQGSRSTV